MQKKGKIFQDLRQKFNISKAEQLEIIENLHSEMEKGLAGETSSLKMLPSFVVPPTGNETGEYLAVDFGGTHFRVLSVNLKGDGKIGELQMEKYRIGKNILTGTKDDLFDFIAGAIADFLLKNNSTDSKEHILGFTFSFAIDQTDVASGKLLVWSKEFDIKGVVGEDVVELLYNALKKRGIYNVKIASLVNDTIGTLACEKYRNKACGLGVILGTGTNGAYIEDVSRIKKHGIPGLVSEQMMINTEWGDYDKLNLTEYDKRLDKASEDPGGGLLEKMVSAKYLGELTKLIINDFAGQHAFSGTQMKQLNERELFSSEDMSCIIGDDSPELEKIDNTLSKYGINQATLNDKFLLKDICKVVMIRSSQLAATLIAGVVLWMDPELDHSHIIAVDGSLYEKATGYKESLKENINKILGKKGDKVKLVLSRDGSGVGAAIVAAAASHQNIFSKNSCT